MAAWSGEISGTTGINPQNTAAPNAVGTSPGKTKAFYVWTGITEDSTWLKIEGEQGCTVVMIADLADDELSTTTARAKILWSGSDSPANDNNCIVMENKTLSGSNPNEAIYEVPPGSIKVQVGGADDGLFHAIHIRTNR